MVKLISAGVVAFLGAAAAAAAVVPILLGSGASEFAMRFWIALGGIVAIPAGVLVGQVLRSHRS